MDKYKKIRSRSILALNLGILIVIALSSLFKMIPVGTALFLIALVAVIYSVWFHWYESKTPDIKE